MVVVKRGKCPTPCKKGGRIVQENCPAEYVRGYVQGITCPDHVITTTVRLRFNYAQRNNASVPWKCCLSLVQVKASPGARRVQKSYNDRHAENILTRCIGHATTAAHKTATAWRVSERDLITPMYAQPWIGCQ